MNVFIPLKLKSWSAGGAISKILRKNLIPCVSRSAATKAHDSCTYWQKFDTSRICISSRQAVSLFQQRALCALGLPLCGLLPLYSIHVHECMRRARGARPSPHSSSVCCVCWGGCIVMKILSFHFSEPIRDDPMHNRKFQQAISSTKPLALSAFMSIIVSILWVCQSRHVSWSSQLELISRWFPFHNATFRNRFFTMQRFEKKFRWSRQPDPRMTTLYMNHLNFSFPKAFSELVLRPYKSFQYDRFCKQYDRVNPTSNKCDTGGIYPASLFCLCCRDFLSAHVSTSVVNPV